jgi:MFS family permease
VTPLYGKLSDIHGRRKVLLVGVAIFVAGSLACALADSMLALIFARGLQGLGGGGLISLAQTIIGDVVAPRERALYQAYIASVFVASSVAGPLLGGLFAEHLHWSLIFWINLPLGALALLTAWRTLRLLPRHERPRRLDLAGAALIVAATVPLMLALSWGGRAYAWDSWPVLGLLAAAAAFAALFALRLATAAEPLLPPAVLLDRVVARGTAAAAFTVGTFVALTIYVPVYFETVLGLGASSSGLALMPLVVGVIGGAVVSGRVLARARRYKRLPLLGLAAAAVGVALLGAWPAGLPLAAVELALGAVGLGIGTVLPVTTVMVQNAVPLDELGTATGVMNFFRSLAGAVGVAGLGAVVAGAAGPEAAPAFGRAYLAAALGFAVALGWLAATEERPLRGPGRGGPAADD